MFWQGVHTWCYAVNAYAHQRWCVLACNRCAPIKVHAKSRSCGTPICICIHTRIPRECVTCMHTCSHACHIRMNGNVCVVIRCTLLQYFPRSKPNLARHLKKKWSLYRCLVAHLWRKELVFVSKLRICSKTRSPI